MILITIRYEKGKMTVSCCADQMGRRKWPNTLTPKSKIKTIVVLANPITMHNLKC